jgi:hypothetical protein
LIEEREKIEVYSRAKVMEISKTPKGLMAFSALPFSRILIYSDIS